MKKGFAFALIFLIFVSVLTIVSSAHSGGTDSNGGHYNSQTGEYHYHHGYPAHSHVGGCPYDNEEEDDSGSWGILEVLFVISAVAFASLTALYRITGNIVFDNIRDKIIWPTVILFIIMIIKYVI